MSRRARIVIAATFTFLGLLSVTGRFLASEPRPIGYLSTTVANHGYQDKGFYLNNKAETAMLKVDHTIWYVPHRTNKDKLSTAPTNGGKYCYYNFYLASRHTGLFNRTDWYWYFQLRQDETWGSDSSYKPGIDWKNPPSIQEPTPAQLWEFLNKWVNNPMPECNPVVR